MHDYHPATRWSIAAIIFAVLFAAFFTETGLSTGKINLIPDSGEAKVYGRLAEAKDNGVFSDGLLTGGCGGEVERFDQGFQLSQFNSQTCEDYYLYKSQSGMQATFFSILQVFGADRTVFKAITSMVTAAVLTAFIVWLADEFGLWVALLTAFGILFLRGLVLLSDNISQVIGVQFLPMVAMLYAYKNKSKHLGRIMFIVTLLKYLVSGYEYLTTDCFLSFAPLLYYALRDGYTLKHAWNDFKWQAGAVIAATFGSLLILAFQISLTTSWSDAFGHFTERLMSRTYFETPDNKPFYYAAMQIGTGDLLREYMGYAAVSVGHFVISFTEFIVALGAVSLAAWPLYKKTQNTKIPALIAFVWWSALGALSWILLFKGHSSYHTFIDPVVWHMPFTIIGVTLTCYVIACYYKHLRSQRRKGSR